MNDWEERFWGKVAPDPNSGCWLWMGGYKGNGLYGAFRIGDKVYMAHRLAYVVSHGTIQIGKIIMHSCDNPICVNPKHLSAGSQKENMIDMVKKQRGTRKFTKHTAEKIRDTYKNNKVTQRELANAYKCSRSTISEICRGSTYHV